MKPNHKILFPTQLNYPAWFLKYLSHYIFWNAKERQEGLWISTNQIISSM